MKRLKLNRWLISSFVLIMMVLVFKSDEKSDMPSVETQNHDADYHMENVTIHQFSESGKQDVTLVADRLEYSALQDVSKLEYPIISYEAGKTSEWRLNSKSGELVEGGSIIKLKSQVHIREHQGKSLIETEISTHDLVIDLEKSIASTDKRVEVENKYYRTLSTGLEINFEQQIIILKSNVKTEIFQ